MAKTKPFLWAVSAKQESPGS